MKALIKVFCSLLIFAFLTSCGGGGDSGGAELLRTVQVLPPTLDRAFIDSDVATWTDVNGDGKVCDFINDRYTINPDTVQVTINVLPLPNLPTGLTASPVRVDSAEIIFTPATSTTPQIPTQYRALGIVINPNSSSPFTLDVVPKDVKMALVDRLICSDTIYQYYVQIKFVVIEIDTGKSGTVQTALTVKLADFAETQ